MRVYYATLKRMGPEERVRQAFRLCAEMRAVLEAGVRRRHPGYSPREVRLETIRLWLRDDDLFRRAYQTEGGP
jgi:hypothetical protein